MKENISGLPKIFLVLWAEKSEKSARFTLRHDNNRRIDELEKADIILAGIRRGKPVCALKRLGPC